MATWSKLFSFFTWKNRPDTSTPLGQTLLNRLNTALNGIDDRVVELNSKMVSSDQIGASITNVRLDEKTGIFTFTRYDGTTFTINTALEEVVTNFKYDNATQQLVLTLSDGTTQDVDLSALITQYEFTNSATILWTITEEGKVVGNIKPNSITDQMLQTNYLADITTQANTAVLASQSALESQSLAEQSSEEAKSQADRAKAEADRAESVSAVDIATTEKAGIVKPDGTTITVDSDGTIHGNASVTVDDVLSTESTNPIANKAVAEALENVDAKTLDGNAVGYFAKETDLEVERQRINNLTANTGAQTQGNSELIDIRVGANGVTYDTAGEAIRGQFNDLKNDKEKVLGLNDGEENSGIVDYDNTWWKQASSAYKHVAIPITGDFNVLRITGGDNASRIAGVKSYTKPTTGTVIDFSEYWNRSIEVKSGVTLQAVIPSDVSYLIVNTLYNNTNCISEFEIVSTNYSDIGKAENYAHGVRTQITISAQNIRDFNVEGGAGEGCPNELVEANLPLWKNHISKSLNSDFLCINEWYQWFDKAGTINAYETIFKPFYPYKYELPEGNPTQILLSKHEGVMINLGDLVAGQFYLPMFVCNIAGKSVAVVCWLQSSSDAYTKRIEYYNKVIPFLNAFDVVILAGDFNTQDTEHFEDEMNVWKNAGYSVGNGGYWGKFNTWNEYPLDNVVVKGAILEDFEVGEKVTSDHNAVKGVVSFIS